MSIPQYPHFSALALEQRAVFEKSLRQSPPVISEHTFTNLFAWRDAYHLRVSLLDGLFVLRAQLDTGEAFFPLIGTGNRIRTMQRLLDETGRRFVRVPEAEALEAASLEGIAAVEDRDNADYLYLREQLAGLSGRRYDGKRNLIRKFKSGTAYDYLALDASNVGQCLPFQQAWCVLKDCDKDAGLQKEQSALFSMIEHFAGFGLSGAAVVIGGRVQAFAIAEELNPETIVLHMLKAEPGIPGLYQTMLNEFIRRVPGRFTYVNMEQDLGIEGLRKAKKSYYPVRMINKYTVERA
ncbi:MAG: phosphatidylglycerol lysyltransferase domain-containing protein [Candidatus Omnitrophica bacterium]|nr:phosphatidylglycerol lysyltransferase domain-containing protein [Candidatus Omnitrophota bacterium]